MMKRKMTGSLRAAFSRRSPISKITTTSRHPRPQRAKRLSRTDTRSMRPRLSGAASDRIRSRYQMLAYLRGQIIHRDFSWVIVDVAGVGYQVYLPSHLQLSVTASVELYCSFQVREDSQTLYGFTNLRERARF